MYNCLFDFKNGSKSDPNCWRDSPRFTKLGITIVFKLDFFEFFKNRFLSISKVKVPSSLHCQKFQCKIRLKTIRARCYSMAKTTGSFIPNRHCFVYNHAITRQSCSILAKNQVLQRCAPVGTFFYFVTFSTQTVSLYKMSGNTCI